MYQIFLLYPKYFNTVILSNSCRLLITKTIFKKTLSTYLDSLADAICEGNQIVSMIAVIIETS